ncbi:MAG: alpha/beta hydrolase [Kiloniellales bacterium]
MSDPMRLSGPSHGPASGGQARRLIILLHGIGADGSDLIALAPQLARVLPDAAFVSPNAPFPCDMAPFGYQWFSLQDRTPAMMLAGVRAAAPILDGFIDDALDGYGLADRDLALVGFSQGTIMSLYVAPRRERPCAGVVGYSGALIGARDWPAEVRSRPPVLLVHGDADPVMPFGAMARAAEELRRADIKVEAHRRPGLGHGIDPTGLELAGKFLASVLAD